MPNSDIQFRDVSGNVNIVQSSGNIYGDIVAGNKTIIQNIIQQAAKQIVTAPYKFLAAYDISDRDIFFGRNAVIEELVGKLPRYKTLVINGRSGSGKTSLINAGLIPRLAENGYHYLSFRDYSDPLRQLREHVVQDELFKTYADQTNSLMQFLKTVTRQQQQHVVVIFDQFERFFVNVLPAVRTQFIQEIKTYLDSDLSGEELDLVFALREDFFGAFVIEFETQIPTFFNQTDRFNLLPLSREEAREAILRPLKNIPAHIGYNLPFVDEVLLPGLMGESAGGTQIDPPHLQIVCNQLYQAVRERYAADLEQGGVAQIDRPLYTELGETSGILRTYLDDFIDRTAHRDAGGRDVLRSMLKLMLETTGTRKFVSLTDLKKGLPDVQPTAIEQHLREFQDGRIIETRGQGEAARYSLSHEVMVPKVQSWFDEREMERKKAQETLERGLAEWKNSQALLNEKQVAHIRTRLGREGLSAEAEQLLTQSQQAYEERKRKEAEQEWRIKRNRNAFQMALGFGLVIAVILSALAFWQWNAAVKEKQRAEEQKKEAEYQSRIAIIRSLVAYALRDNAQDERERAALLARHAYLLNQRYHGDVAGQIDAAFRTIFHTDSITAEPYSPLLAEQVCQKVKLTIALTSEEWNQFTGNALPYESACPELQAIYPLHLRHEKMSTDDYMALSLNMVDACGYVNIAHHIQNQFEDQGDVIFDRTTGLAWQKAGPDKDLMYEEAQAYMGQLNRDKFGGYTDWRLPTVEELLSLLAPKNWPQSSNDLYLNPIFVIPAYVEYPWYWSADIYQTKGESSFRAAWDVSFGNGNVHSRELFSNLYVRAVRS
jgi:hypothetical protein